MRDETRNGAKRATSRMIVEWIAPTFNVEGWKLPLEHGRTKALQIYVRRLIVVTVVFVLDIGLLGLCRVLGFGQAGLIASSVLMIVVSVACTLTLSESLLRELERKK